jgi:hypothetical protein
MSDICFKDISPETATKITLVVSSSLSRGRRLLIVSWYKLIKPGLIYQYGLLLRLKIVLFASKTFKLRLLAFIDDFEVSHFVW